MRKFILLFLFVVTSTVAYNQIIKGTVFDNKTKNAIGFASIYFNGTFVGTTSDKSGCFVLDVSNNSTMPLVISAIGYYSTTITGFSTGEVIRVYLKPKDYELQEAVIKTNSLKRKRKQYLALFREEFLGTTNNSWECKILNENDITFNYGSDQDTLKAFTSRPILVDNTGLGYKITYYLDKFEYYKKREATFFYGNVIFKEDSTSNDQRMQFNERRKHTYIGSRTHFFRTLWSDTFKSNGFAVLDSLYKNVKYKDMVIKDQKNDKFFSYPTGLRLMYNKKGSYIIFLKEYVYFDKTGYFDPSGIKWEGEMANQRIADWLPYEFSIEK